MSDRRNTLRPGDIVSRPKGVVRHVGVVVEDGVLHNVPGRGEHVSSLESFAAGRPVRVERPDRSRGFRTVARASHDFGGRRYDLLNNNCEHSVNRLHEGRAHSPQLRRWALGAAGAVAGGLLLRHWGAAVAGFQFGRRLADRFD